MGRATKPQYNEDLQQSYFEGIVQPEEEEDASARDESEPQSAQDESEPQSAANGESIRRRRSPLERTIASLLRARETVGPEDLAREVEARFKELAELKTDYARKDVISERTVAYNEVLKKKVKALKRQLLELALAVDED